MELVARFDNYGRPAWLAVMILGFIVFWPIGLMVLGYLIWSGRMGCGKHGGAGRWHFYGADSGRSRGGKRSHGGRHGGAASGNAAFDEYRDETLRRLEDERAEFEGYLERLRHAKDKAEFDAFMDEQRRKSEEPEGSDIPPETPPAPDDPEPRPNA